MRAQLLMFGRTGLCDVGCAMQPHDLRRSIERAEHEDDATVLTQVGDRFDAAAGEVEIGNLTRAEDAKGIESLWRTVDESAGIERRRCHEKHPLLPEPCRQL